VPELSAEKNGTKKRNELTPSRGERKPLEEADHFSKKEKRKSPISLNIPFPPCVKVGRGYPERLRRLFLGAFGKGKKRIENLHQRRVRRSGSHSV